MHGFISPTIFIPIAEETGNIIPLGEWIIQEACRIAVSWPQDIHVAINISAIQFRHSDLASIVRDSSLTKNKLKPNRLELEITESGLPRGERRGDFIAAPVPRHGREHCAG